MKKLIQTCAISLCMTTMTLPAMADDNKAAVQQGAVFGSAAILGGIAGGPVGFLAGAIAGAFIGEEMKQGVEAEAQVANYENEIADLQESLTVSQHQLELQLESNHALSGLIEQLPREVFFASNSDLLTQDGIAILNTLALVIKNDPAALVTLTGHTDPRGSDDYNNVLSLYRAKAVKDYLVMIGLNEGQIAIGGVGSDQSQASSGDTQAYKKERRVDIKIESETGFAYAY